MFESARNTPERVFIIPVEENVVFDANQTLDKKLEAKLRRRSRLPLKIAAAALAFATIDTAYWSDVNENRAEQAAAEVTINVIGKPLDEANSTKATVFIDGFNTYDANYLAKSVGPAVQQVADGELWSLSYNNAILNRKKIYETIVDLAKERGIESVSVAGYSMGGIIAVEAASDIIVNSSIEVNSIDLMHTPDGSDGLQPYQKKELGFAQNLAEWVPGAIDSSWVRFAGELYFYKNNYTKGQFKDWDIAHNTGVLIDNAYRFTRTFGSILEKFDNPKQASMQLLTEQVYKINQFDMLDELKKITEHRKEKQMPVVIYLGMEADSLVKDELTAENFYKYTHATDIDYFSYTVPDAVHSQYNRSIDEYMKVFEAASGPVSADIKDEAKKHTYFLYRQEQVSIQARDN